MTTLYAFVLQAALAEEPGVGEEAVSHGVVRLVGCRAQLDALTRSVGPTPAAERARASLDYDLGLIRLCGQLGIEHRFFSGIHVDSARELTENDLMAQLPALRDVLRPSTFRGPTSLHLDTATGETDPHSTRRTSD